VKGQRPRIRIGIDDVVEVIAEVAPEVRDALRKDSPGGRRLTPEELEQIGRELVTAIWEQAGEPTPVDVVLFVTRGVRG
jgi:hypothetical protein